MKTKMKTRLMAFFITITMLVTMMAAYALPVVAEEIDTLPNVQDFASNSGAAGYLVTSLDDMAFVAKNKASIPAGKILYLTANITVPAAADDTENKYQGINNMNGLLASIDGQGHTISGLNLGSSPWLGNYAATASIKNITFENCKLTNPGWNNGGLLIGNYGAAGTKLTLENVTIKKCSNTTTSNGSSLLVGLSSIANVEIVMTNIRVDECTLDRSDADNSGLLIGRLDSTATLKADGIYLINNTIKGATTAQKSGRGLAFGEVTCKGYIKNVGIFNTTIDGTDSNITAGRQRGILIGGAKNNAETLTVENVIAVNNGAQYTTVVATSEASGKVSVSKVYTDVANLVDGKATDVANSAVYTTEQFNSGKAAYDANAAITTTDLKKWEMAPGAAYPSFDTDGAGLPVAVTLKVGENETTLYTNTNGNLIGLTAAHTAGVNWENDAVVSATAVYTQDVTITGTVDAAVADLNNLLTYFEGKDSKYFESATYEGSLDDLIAEIKANMANYTVADYQAKAAALGSFGYKAYPNIPSASEYETYTDSLHFIVKDLADLNKVAEYKDKFTVNQTIHLAENIVITITSADAANNMNGLSASINGHGSTIKGVTVPATSWLATYDGKTVENLVMDSWVGNSLNAYGALLVGQNGSSTLTLKNITAIDCIATKPLGNGMAILLGKLYGAGNVVNISNISIKGCTLNRIGNKNGNGGYDGGNSAFVVGRLESGTLNLDGAYLDGNFINGDTNWNGQGGNSGGTGIVLGEVTGTANVSNVAVYNTTLGENADLYGVLAGEFKGAGVMTAKNVVVCNSTDKNIINGANTPTTANIYTDTALLASGEAAYMMNQSSETVKWEMAVGAILPSFDTDGKGAAVKLTYQVEGNTVATLYTDAVGKPIGNVEDPAKENHIFEGWENSAESYTADTVLKAILTAIALGDLNANGAVELADVILLLQHLVGYEVEFLSSADINGDGRVSIFDAICLLKMT